DSSVEIAIIDGRKVREADRRFRLIALAQSAAATRFHLCAGPLARFNIIDFADDDLGVVIVVHHIICDYWSLGSMLRDFARALDGAALTPIPPSVGSARNGSSAHVDDPLSAWAAE